MRNEILNETLPSAVSRLLPNFLLILFWGTGLLVVFRWRGFTAESVGVVAFVLLALLVVGTILMLDFLEGERWKMLLAVGPGVFITVFLVLPSWHFAGISAYLVIFLPAILFLGHKYRYANTPLAVAPPIDLEVLEAAEWDKSVQMRLLRRKESGEVELLEAWVRADFQQGERVVNLHVPFCPPFVEQPQGQPQWETCQFEGNEVDIQVSQINALGTRIDLKRPAQRKDQESVGVYLAVRSGIIQDF